jgi:hypothetical protein
VIRKGFRATLRLVPVRLKRCSGKCGGEKLLDEFWKDSKQPDGRMTRCIPCVKEERHERQERRARGEVVPAVSAEERKRRSERALALHKEGRFGGSEYGQLGGRPRKPSINEAIVEHFRERSGLVVRAVESALRSKSKSDRMRAVEFLSKAELSHDAALRDARGAGKTPEEMTEEELREFVAQALAARIEAGDFADVITLAPSQFEEVPAA